MEKGLTVDKVIVEIPERESGNGVCCLISYKELILLATSKGWAVAGHRRSEWTYAWQREVKWINDLNFSHNGQTSHSFLMWTHFTANMWRLLVTNFLLSWQPWKCRRYWCFT